MMAKKKIVNPVHPLWLHVVRESGVLFSGFQALFPPLFGLSSVVYFQEIISQDWVNFAYMNTLRPQEVQQEIAADGAGKRWIRILYFFGKSRSSYSALCFQISYILFNASAKWLPLSVYDCLCERYRWRFSRLRLKIFARLHDILTIYNCW